MAEAEPQADQDVLSVEGTFAQLYDAQRDIAGFLQTAFFAVREHPDRAKDEPTMIESGLDSVEKVAEEMLEDVEHTKQCFAEMQMRPQIFMGDLIHHHNEKKRAIEGIKLAAKQAHWRRKMAEERIMVQTKALDEIESEMKSHKEERKKQRKYYTANSDEQFNKAENQISEDFRRYQEAHREKLDYTEKRLEQLFKMKRLALQAASTGDISGLVEALAPLTSVDQLLYRLINWSQQITECIARLKHDTTASKMFIKHIEKAAVQQRFIKYIEQTKEKWSAFEEICNRYQQRCRDETDMYGFLSMPIDCMSEAEIQMRQKEFEDKISKEIEEEEGECY